MIKINCYKVNETGNKYKEDAEYLREIKTKMKEIKSGIKEAWNNSENVNFLASFEDHINSIDKYIDFLDDKGNILIDVSGKHNESERSFKKNVEEKVLNELEEEYEYKY